MEYKCKHCWLKGTMACPVDNWSPTASEYSDVCDKFQLKDEHRTNKRKMG